MYSKQSICCYLCTIWIFTFGLVQSATNLRHDEPDASTLDILTPSSQTSEWNVNASDVANAIMYATSYIVRNCNEEGRFTYLASLTDPKSYATSKKYNMLRHSGAIYALGMSYERHPDVEVLAAMERGVKYLKRIAIGPVLLPTNETTEDDMLAVWSSEAVSGEKGQPPMAKLGGAGLALIALTSLERAKAGSTPIEDMRQLANFILFMQNEDGGFISRYIPSKGGKDTSFVSLYYPGEAALGLLSLYEFDPDPRYVAGAAKAIAFLYNIRKDQPLSKIEPDHWALLATKKLFQTMEGGDHPDCSSAMAIQHGSKVCRSILFTPEKLQNLGGCLIDDMRTCPTSTRLEGLGAALLFLPSGTEMEVLVRKKVGYNMDAGIQYLLRSQTTEIGDKMNMQGAFPKVYPFDDNKAKDSVQVRIDYVQHALSSLIGYEKERLQETTYIIERHEEKLRGNTHHTSFRYNNMVNTISTDHVFLTMMAFGLIAVVILLTRPKKKVLFHKCQ